MKLQLGFENIPYSGVRAALPPSMGKRLARRPSPAQLAYGQGKTTGEVATDLEKKYGIVEKFYTLEENFIVDAFENSYLNAMELGMLSGSWGVTWDPSITLEPKFKRSLSSKRFDGLIPGVPTLAAQRGVSHLRQAPFASRSSRPSFIDTSLYQRSFKAWTEV
jgi:hypothetical protein